MGWVLRLVEMGPGGETRSVDLLEIDRPTGLADIANLGLTLSEAKQLLARVQQGVVTAQSGPRSCGSSARLCVLRRTVSYQGLAAASDRDTVRRSDRATSAMALYWL